MSIRFSRITATAKTKAAIFLASGIPSSKEELECWTAYKSFISELQKKESIDVSVETFEYGEGEPFDATPEEVAYIYMRENMRAGFIEARTKKVAASSFVIKE